MEYFKSKETLKAKYLCELGVSIENMNMKLNEVDVLFLILFL